MNGDILTDIDYRELLDYHREKEALATIATYQRDSKIDFGVLEHDADEQDTQIPGEARIPLRREHGYLCLPA